MEPSDRPRRSVLDAPTLVLNRSWVPFHVTIVRRAVGMICRGIASVVDPGSLSLQDFDAWASLRGEPGRHSIRTATRWLPVPEIVQLAGLTGCRPSKRRSHAPVCSDATITAASIAVPGRPTPSSPSITSCRAPVAAARAGTTVSSPASAAMPARAIDCPGQRACASCGLRALRVGHRISTSGPPIGRAPGTSSSAMVTVGATGACAIAGN